MSAFGSRRKATDIKVSKTDKTLTATFDDGAVFTLPAELLRVESPSAEVQGHGPGEKQLVAGRSHVGIIGIEPVGHYAVKIIFDDLHDSGLYTWDYLYELGADQQRIWGEYVTAMEAAGLSRHPNATNSGPVRSGGCGGGGKGGCG